MSTAANPTPASSVFGEFSVDFLHPQEFTLPDELLPSGGVGGPIASASAQGTLHSGPGVVNALNVAKCKWSVVSMPPSVSATTIAITTSSSSTPSPTTTTTSNEAAETSAISEAADKLFIQALTAASTATTNGGGVGGASRAKDVPFMAGEESLVSSLSTTSGGGAHHPYGFLRMGMDPAEPLPTGITLPMLLSSISQLAATYGLDQQHSTATADSSSSSSPVAAEAFGGLFSRNSILFLAWQRVSQLVTEAELSRRLTCSPPLSGVKAVALTTTPLGLKRQRDSEEHEEANTSSSVADGPPLLSTIYQPITETGFESKVSHLRAISALLGDRLRNGTHLTSKGIQTCLQVPGLNTTSPFVDTAAASNHQHSINNNNADSSSNNGADGSTIPSRSSEVEAVLSSILIPAGNTIGAASLSPAPRLQQQQPSHFTIKLWNAALGLTSTDSRTMEHTLNYGTTTFGHSSSSNSADDNPSIVSLSDVALPGASIARMAFRLCITSSTPSSDNNTTIKGEGGGGGASTISCIPCGGAAGIRVEGRRWTMSDVININEHDVVHVGGGIAFTIRQQAAAASTVLADVVSCNTTTPPL